MMQALNIPIVRTRHEHALIKQSLLPWAMLKALQRNRTAKDTEWPKNRPGSLQAVLGDFIFHKDQGIAITFFFHHGRGVILLTSESGRPIMHDWTHL